jgi:hypothetical protein
VFGSVGEEGYLCVLMRGLFDESGTHNDARVTTIAGWIFATRDHARECLVQWHRGLEVMSLDSFHASNFDHFAKVSKWSDDDRTRHLQTLAAIVGKFAWFGVSGSVVTSAYDALPDWVRERIGDRYHFCFHVLMNQLKKRIESVTSPEPLNLTFEKKDHVIGRTTTEYHRDYAGGIWGGLLFLDKTQAPLLQAADFLVYEMNKGIDIALHKHGPIRPALKAIGSLKKVRFGYHDAETLNNLVSALEKDRNELPGGWLGEYVWWPAAWHRNYSERQ